MKTQRNIFVSIIAIAAGYLILPLICNNAIAQDAKGMKGAIYLGGEIFGKINLESRKWEAVYKGAGHVYCAFPNAISNNLFILETKGSQVEYFDVLSNKFTFITEGVDPLYVPEVESVFYYRYNQGLFQKSLEGNQEDKLITDNIHFSPDLIQNSPIRISSEEIAYYTKDKRIEIYNHVNRRRRFIGVVACEPVAFYANKNSLICKDKTDKNIYFVDIISSNKEKLFISNSEFIGFGIVAIDGYKCLVYSKNRIGLRFWENEYKDAWIYWVDSKKEEMFLKNTDISSALYVKGE